MMLKSLRSTDEYICVGEFTIIGSDNDLAPDRPQAIVYTNAGVLLIRASGKNQWNLKQNSYISS